MTSKLFSELGLSPAVLKAIDRLGYEKAAPIQSEAIPLIMGGSDVVGQSQTGSGKTAAFGIPAVESVDPHLRAVQVIILCPTRELAGSSRGRNFQTLHINKANQRVTSRPIEKQKAAKRGLSRKRRKPVETCQLSPKPLRRGS